MAFIKCPECGQTALSIASVCPKCGHLLMQHTPPQGGGDTLQRCPRCRKYVDRRATQCEFCAFPLTLWRRVRWGMLALLGIAVVVAATIGFRSLRSGPSGEQATQLPEPALPAPTIAPTTPVPEDSTPVVAVPILVDAPPSPDTLVDPVPTVPAVDTEDRWLVTWANLREGPGLDYPVLRILLPGERVRVARPARGFAAVYGSEGLEGYVAVSLLSDRELPRDSLARVEPR
jgi:hypothetical protein